MSGQSPPSLYLAGGAVLTGITMFLHAVPHTTVTVFSAQSAQEQHTSITLAPLLVPFLTMACTVALVCYAAWLAYALFVRLDSLQSSGAGMNADEQTTITVLSNAAPVQSEG